MDTTPKFLSIAWRIASIRNSKGKSQTVFGKSIGLSQSAYSELELGNKKPTMPVLLAIEYVYGVRKEWVLTGEEPMYLTHEGPGTPISIAQSDGDTDRHIKMWINKLKRIFEEGNEVKIDAVKAQLRVFDPGVKKQNGTNEEDGGDGVEGYRVA